MFPIYKHTRMNDGTEKEFGAGEVTVIRPGHDAWIVRNEACIGVDFIGGKHTHQR
jgi:hypothetical protein